MLIRITGNEMRLPFVLSPALPTASGGHEKAQEATKIQEHRFSCLLVPFRGNTHPGEQHQNGPDTLFPLPRLSAPHDSASGMSPVPFSLWQTSPPVPFFSLTSRAQPASADLLKKSIQRTLHSDPRSIQHMGVNHRRRDVAVPQQVLHRADICSAFQQVRGEGMSQTVRMHCGRQFSSLSGRPE